LTKVRDREREPWAERVSCGRAALRDIDFHY
jgi:hypothetical protein